MLCPQLVQDKYQFRNGNELIYDLNPLLRQTWHIKVSVSCHERVSTDKNVGVPT